MLFHKLSLSLVLIGLSASLSASDEGEDRYFGMTQQQFESCIRYGKAVVDSKASKNKKKGREVYEAARTEFKSHCDPKKQLSYAITHLVPKLGPKIGPRSIDRSPPIDTVRQCWSMSSSNLTIAL